MGKSGGLTGADVREKSVDVGHSGRLRGGRIMSLDHPAITDSFSLPSNGGSGDAAAPAHEWTTHSAPDGT